MEESCSEVGPYMLGMNGSIVCCCCSAARCESDSSGVFLFSSWRCCKQYSHCVGSSSFENSHKSGAKNWKGTPQNFRFEDVGSYGDLSEVVVEST